MGPELKSLSLPVFQVILDKLRTKVPGYSMRSSSVGEEILGKLRTKVPKPAMFQLGRGQVLLIISEPKSISPP